MSLYGDGKLGLGTTTPKHQLSLASAGGLTNALHIVNSTINKNLTTQAQSTDSASIWLGTHSTGIPALRLVGPGDATPDSLSISASSTVSSIKSKNEIQLWCGSTYVIIDGSSIYPAIRDARYLGYAGSEYQGLFLTDLLRLGGKGQTAKLIIGTQNTMTEETDSCTVITPTAGSGSVMLASSVGSIVNFVGIQPPTYVSAINQMWVNTGRDTLFIRGATGNAFYSKLTDLGSAH